ncbi:MAG: hypothetical protein ABI831_21385 [Betaproteobacteria bacterium]
MNRSSFILGAVAAIAVFCPGLACAATCNWTGLLANWSAVGNWSCLNGTQTGDDLIFPDAGLNKAMNNNIEHWKATQ